MRCWLPPAESNDLPNTLLVAVDRSGRGESQRGAGSPAFVSPCPGGACQLVLLLVMRSCRVSRELGSIGQQRPRAVDAGHLSRLAPALVPHSFGSCAVGATAASEARSLTKASLDCSHATANDLLYTASDVDTGGHWSMAWRAKFLGSYLCCPASPPRTGSSFNGAASRLVG